jgi:hypothetical protein
VGTNKPVMKTTQQYQSDFVMTYSPIVGLFLPKSQQYDEKVGKLELRRIEAVGDIRGKRYTPKDTHVHQINVTEREKTFKKYFDKSQFVISGLQDNENVDEVVNQVLDEHNAQMDERFLMGDAPGTTPGTQLNNGLFLSSDSNYTLESSTEIAFGNTRLSDFHTKVVGTAQKSDQIAGRKLIMFYGNVVPLFNSLYATSQVAWKQALQDVLGPDYALAVMPEEITPSGANGWIVANLDQCKLHYITLPKLVASGYDERNDEYWFNFLQASCMLEVLAKNGVIHQPSTLALS